MKIFLGRDFNTTPEISSADQFDWRIQGESDFDYLGISGDVMDVNADGLPDVLVGASQGGERSIGTSNHRVGHVGVYLGQPNDSPKGRPTRKVTEKLVAIGGGMASPPSRAHTLKEPLLGWWCSRAAKTKTRPPNSLTWPSQSWSPPPQIRSMPARLSRRPVKWLPKSKRRWSTRPSNQRWRCRSLSRCLKLPMPAMEALFLILGRLSIFGPSRKSVLHPPGNQESPTRRPHGSMPFSRTKPMALGSLRVTFPPRALAKNLGRAYAGAHRRLGLLRRRCHGCGFFAGRITPTRRSPRTQRSLRVRRIAIWPIRSLRP